MMLAYEPPSLLGINCGNDQLAVCLEGVKARLKDVQRVFRPVSRLPTLSDPPNEFFLTGDKGLALGNVPVGLREMPTLLIGIVHCRAPRHSLRVTRPKRSFCGSFQCQLRSISE